ncbi:DUF5753 domain-containing protein [Streptomyces sp. NPDC057654]|uniref:DUF5753 domain-containing protein n=1 Tax=Streptomyces sp. NPDC057654 TaxID=3346196 RepID=UPI0036945F62
MAVSDDRSVALCRIVLRLELRRLREAKEMNASFVAKKFGWSTARMTRLETQNSSIEVPDVKALCELYEAPRELQEQLESFALITKTRKDWWETQPFKGTVPHWFQAFLGLESAASQIRIYQSEFTPGLAQTPDYARVILSLSDTSPEALERKAEVRLKRQSILTRSAHAPQVAIILNEAVIWRPVGGQAVMRQQLDSILALAEQPNVIIRVLPYSAGAHPAMHGPFQILSFTDETVGDLVYLENLVDAGVLADAQQVAPYVQAFDALSDLATTTAESVEMIRSRAAAL